MGGSHHRLVLLCPSNGIKILSQFRELRARCVVDKRGRIMGRWAISAACAPCPTNLLPNAPPSFILPPPSAPAKPQPAGRPPRAPQGRACVRWPGRCGTYAAHAVATMSRHWSQPLDPPLQHVLPWQAAPVGMHLLACTDASPISGRPECVSIPQSEVSGGKGGRGETALRPNNVGAYGPMHQRCCPCPPANAVGPAGLLGKRPQRPKSKRVAPAPIFSPAAAGGRGW